MEVLIRVMALAPIEAKASGIRKRLAGTFALRANPITMGMKSAVEAVLLMKALKRVTVAVTSKRIRFELVPVCLRILRETISMTPVRSMAAVSTRSPPKSTTVSLPKPPNALFSGTSPVSTSTISRARAITSGGNRSEENRYTATSINPSNNAIWTVICE